MEVEIDHGPQDVSDPRAIVLFGLEQPFGVFDEVGDAGRRSIYPAFQTTNKHKREVRARTCGRGADAGLLIQNHL